MTDVMTDAALPGVPPPPPAPMATPTERAALLRQLRARRRELVNAFAIGSCIANTAPALSSLWPLATVQAAIAAVEAAIARDVERMPHPVDAPFPERRARKTQGLLGTQNAAPAYGLCKNRTRLSIARN